MGIYHTYPAGCSKLLSRVLLCAVQRHPVDSILICSKQKLNTIGQRAWGDDVWHCLDVATTPQSPLLSGRARQYVASSMYCSTACLHVSSVLFSKFKDGVDNNNNNNNNKPCRD